MDGDYIPPKRRIGQQDDASSAESESDDDDDDRDDDECSDEGDNGVNVVAHQRDLDDDEVVEDDPSTLVSLYSDFTRGSSSDPSNIASSSRLGDKNNSSGNITDSSNFTSVLLAHLANPSASPLTRRRYQVLLRPLAPFSGSGYQHQQQLDGWDRGEGGVEQAIEGRLQELATLSKGKGKQVEGSSVEASGMQVDGAEGDSEREERERRRLCVVCVCEERTIICWPCRESLFSSVHCRLHSSLVLHNIPYPNGNIDADCMLLDHRLSYDVRRLSRKSGGANEHDESPLHHLSNACERFLKDLCTLARACLIQLDSNLHCAPPSF